MHNPLALLLLALTLPGCGSPPATATATPATSEPNTAVTASHRPATVDHHTPPGTDPAPSAAPADADAEPSASPVAGVDDLVGPLRFDPDTRGVPANKGVARSDRENSMMDYPIEFGWAADSLAFGYCMPSGGADCTTCRLVPTDGKAPAQWTRGSECEKDDARQITKVWRDRKIGKQPIPATWAFGRDLAIAWRRLDGKEATATASQRLAQLDVGAKVGADKPVYFLTMKEPSFAEFEPNYLIAPEIILPSPDGQWLAIVSHAFAGEYSDTLSTRLTPTAAFAFDAYHRTALTQLATNPGRAVQLLEVAAKIKPDAWKVHHNLACAYARLGEPDKAQAPLRQSIALGGDKARDKARTDADLTAVRDQPWFLDLVR